MNPVLALGHWIEKRFFDGGVGGSTYGMSMGLPTPVLSGIAVTPETALTFTSCFACINVLATDCASIPMEVKRRRKGKGTVAVLNDPRYDMVHCEPNKNTTPMRFYQAMWGHRHGWGNGYAEIVRYKGMPVELHLHSPRPSDTWPELRNGNLWYQVDHGRRQIRGEDMIHVAGLGFNGLTGYCAIVLHAQAIGYGKAMEEHGAAFHGNACTPKGALKFPKKMSAEAQKNIRESYTDVHAGTANAHRLLILEEGAEFQGLSISPEATQEILARNFQNLEMNRIFRVPPHKTMDYSNAGSAYRALEESNQDYITTTIGPEIEGFEQELNRKFFTKRERAHGLMVTHDYSALLRGSMQARADYYTKRLAQGSITPDQIAEREGDAPVPGAGMKYFISTNLVPLESAGEPKALPVPDPAGDPEPDDVAAAEDSESETEGDVS